MSDPRIQAKLRKLKKLARETAELAAEIFGDIVSASSNPKPPKPKKGTAMFLLASNPVPPKPKLEALADIAHGSLTIEESLPALDPAQ